MLVGEILNLALPTQEKFYYQTWIQASQAAQALGIKSREEYHAKRSQDKNLPLHPDIEFKSVWHKNQGWTGFLGYPKRKYICIEDAMYAVRLLRIRLPRTYKTRYKKDPLLPANPKQAYPKDWKRVGKWRGYLANNKKGWKPVYPTFEQWATAVQKLRVISLSDYYLRYHLDPRLRANPKDYLLDWEAKGKWYGLLGKTLEETDYYSTYQEAARATQQFNFSSAHDYRRQRKQLDPRLPPCPNKEYPDEWVKNGRWFGYLGKNRPTDLYPFAIAMQLVQLVGFPSARVYREVCKEVDEQLPAYPEDVYPREWQRIGKWIGYLGKS